MKRPSGTKILIPVPFPPSGLKDSASILAGITGGLRLPCVIDAREGTQGSARGGCQQNRAISFDKLRMTGTGSG